MQAVLLCRPMEWVEGGNEEGFGRCIGTGMHYKLDDFSHMRPNLKGDIVPTQGWDNVPS